MTYLYVAVEVLILNLVIFAAVFLVVKKIAKQMMGQMFLPSLSSATVTKSTVMTEGTNG